MVADRVRTVRRTRVGLNVVETVWLGQDARPGAAARRYTGPLLWETRAAGSHIWFARYASLRDALLGHDWWCGWEWDRQSRIRLARARLA